MKDSATNITLAVGCAVTALTLSTTCFLTVNAVLAYVSGDPHSSARGRGTEDPIVPAVFESRKLAASALPDRAASVVRTNMTGATRHRITAVSTPVVAYSSEARPVPSILTDSASSPSPPPAPVGATAESPAPRQEQARAPAELSVAEEVAVVISGAELAQCGEGSLASTICREATRWNICHPNGWNKTPECIVQQFEVFIQ